MIIVKHSKMFLLDCVLFQLPKLSNTNDNIEINI